MPSRFIRELGLLSTAKRTIERKTEKNDFLKEKTLPIFSRESLFKEEKTQKEEKDVSIYKVGQKVSHPRFGEGEIVFISDDGLVGDIVFEDFGKKSLMLNLAPLKIL